MKVFVRARWRLQSKDDIRVILRAGHKAPVGISMDCLIIRHRRSFLKSFPRSLVLLLLPSAFCLLTFLAYLLIHRHLSCRPIVNGSPTAVYGNTYGSNISTTFMIWCDSLCSRVEAPCSQCRHF